MTQKIYHSVLDKTLKGISGVQLNNQIVFITPGQGPNGSRAFFCCTVNIYLIFFVIIKNILLKNKFKVALHYLLNVLPLSNTLIYLKLKFKLKKDPKTCAFKNLKEIFQKLFATLYLVRPNRFFG